MTPAEHAQAQLDAYNAHDIDRFVACFAEDVEVFDFPSGERRTKGRAAMRKGYGAMFAKGTVHAEVLQRIVQGAVVIDQEHVTGLREEPVAAVAIYEIEDDIIRRVWFVRDR